METENADLKRLTNAEINSKLAHAYGLNADGSPRVTQMSTDEIAELMGWNK